VRLWKWVMSYEQTNNAPPGFSVCPSCHTQFCDRAIYRIPQIAWMLGVSQSTVGGYMRKGLLPFRLWARGGGSVIRVATARDFDIFLEAKLGRPGDGSLAARLWDFVHRKGISGPQAKRNKQQAKLKAQAAESNEDSTPTSAPCNHPYVACPDGQCPNSCTCRLCSKP
jgi:hypothetical protein